MKQARYKEPLPLAVIEAARAGDAGAVEQVLQYYNGYINKLCRRMPPCSFAPVFGNQTA